MKTYDLEKLSESEREGLIEAVQAGNEVEYVESVIYQRLSDLRDSIIALADDWFYKACRGASDESE
jgi:hypothetical protein